MFKAEAREKLRTFLRDECIGDEWGWTADARTDELLALLETMGVTFAEPPPVTEAEAIEALRALARGKGN